MTPASAPWWVELIVGALLLVSAAVTLAAGWGLARLPHYFQRMHPPALVYVAGAWCVCLASTIHFSAQSQGPRLHVWIIVILLSITVPIATLLLSRVGLFRARQAGDATLPPPLQPGTPGPASAGPEASDAEQKSHPVGVNSCK